MTVQYSINGREVEVLRGDLTDLAVDAVVFYARNDLQLGSGFGTAISLRGGPSVQEEATVLAPVQLTHAVATSAGELKAKYILHAVGPKFQEENIAEKLRATMANVLELAEAKGIESLAFPPMGTGFYGVPLSTCADVMTDTITSHLSRSSGIKQIKICMIDTREFQAFKERLDKTPAIA